MKLNLLEVCGFRRFRKETKLALNGKLVALLGPNEAGKSSVLRAVYHLNIRGQVYHLAYCSTDLTILPT